jgi:hypothetical protein
MKTALLLGIAVAILACAPDEAATIEAPWLVETTESSGVRFVHDAARTPRNTCPRSWSSGIAAFDADGDGDPDLLRLQSGPSRTACRESPEPRTARASSATAETDVSTKFRTRFRTSSLDPSASPAPHYDGDGRTDIFLANLGGDTLLRNRRRRHLRRRDAARGNRRRRVGATPRRGSTPTATAISISTW